MCTCMCVRVHFLAQLCVLFYFHLGFSGEELLFHGVVATAVEFVRVATPEAPPVVVPRS